MGGVSDGATLFLVRRRAPPQAVRLNRPEEDRADLCFGSVCGCYERTEQMISDRPFYQSTFNSKFLFYQAGRERWVVADNGEWSGYADNAWAYCPSQAQCPSELVGVPWNVSDKTYRNFPECAVSLEIVEE